MRCTSIVTSAAAGVLAAISGLHIAWGLGSSFPLADREQLLDSVAGGGDHAPGPFACFAVAACLATSAAAVSGHPRALPRLRRLAAATTTGVLGARALLGLAGRTDLVAPGGHVSDLFRRRDRRVYAPLCLALSIAAVPAWHESSAAS